MVYKKQREKERVRKVDYDLTGVTKKNEKKTYDNKQRTRLLDAVILAPLPGNKSINNDCPVNMMAAAV